eukprot:SM000034S12741  [mRNA]  locus=s34:542322:545262:+ [translate_table: standard]
MRSQPLMRSNSAAAQGGAAPGGAARAASAGAALCPFVALLLLQLALFGGQLLSATRRPPMAALALAIPSQHWMALKRRLEGCGGLQEVRLAETAAALAENITHILADGGGSTMRRRLARQEASGAKSGDREADADSRLEVVGRRWRGPRRRACDQPAAAWLRGTVEWNPEPDRFLLAMCSEGLLSHRLVCLRQNMLDAALLNRTLVLPTRSLDYDYDTLLDLEQLSDCLGPGRVVAYDELVREGRGRTRGLRVNRFVCHLHTSQKEEVCSQVAAKYRERLGAVFPKAEVPAMVFPNAWAKYSAAQFARLFACADRVLALGNMYGVSGKELRFEGGAPLIMHPGCFGILQPSRAIQEAAVSFANAFLGTRFTAVHLRRGNFLGHCLRSAANRTLPCFQPLSQVGECLGDRLRHLPGGPPPSLFLATDADDDEVEALQNILRQQQELSMAVYRLPREISGQEWAAPLRELPVPANHDDARHLLDKAICSLAANFFGSLASAFSRDIFRLRDTWQTRTPCDTFICPANLQVDIFHYIS